MQYLLIDTALLVLYLLLLSLARHVGFTTAYTIGAVTYIGLLFWYLHLMLATTRGVRMTTALLVATYDTMFVLTEMQQYNLLAGPYLLFVALFAMMYYTREIDWYALNKSQGKTVGGPLAASMVSHDNDTGRTD